MKTRLTYRRHPLTTFALTAVALGAVFSCTVDTDDLVYVPDDVFKNSGGSGGSGSGSGGTTGSGDGGEGGDAPVEMCDPGDIRCTDEGFLQTCQDGTPPAWDEGEDCGSLGRCSVSRNKCLECTPGEFRCDEATLEQCDMIGETFEVVQTCEEGAAACVGMGQTGYCQVCDPGASVCDSEVTSLEGGEGDNSIGSEIRTCAPSGGYTEVADTCVAFQSACDLENMECVDCVPGTIACFGAEVRECTDEGWWDHIESCDADETCDKDAGQCVPANGQCTPGQAQCTNGTVQTCNQFLNWQDEETCTTPGQCDAFKRNCAPCDLTVPSQCQAGVATDCVGAPGGGPVVVWKRQTCAGPCANGGVSNFCETCVENSRQCIPNNTNYDVCNNMGVYQGNYACPGNQICLPDDVSPGNPCGVCYPSTYRCDGQDLYLCNADGQGETLIQDCGVGDNQHCSAEHAACLPVMPGNYACVKDGSDWDWAYVDTDGTIDVIESCPVNCDFARGCMGEQCVEGDVACDGREPYVCTDGFWLEPEESCSSAAVCQPGIGCTIPVALGAGYAHSCAVMVHPDAPDDPGFVSCWGANEHGQLGNGAAILGDSVDPQRVMIHLGAGTAPNGVTFTSFGFPFFMTVCGGLDFSCSDLQDPENPGNSLVGCWGSNEFGQMGLDILDPGPFNGLEQPFTVRGENWPTSDGMELRNVTCGEQFACALDDAGKAFCWGRNDARQLGADVDDDYLPYAVEVVGDHNFIEISAGAKHACGVKADGSVWCWGDGSLGQTGLASGDDPVVEPTEIEDFAATGSGEAFPAFGRDFSAILSPEEDNPASWGGNLFGQLGDGTTEGRATPGAMSEVTTPNALALFSSSRAQHLCIRGKDGQLSCLGANVFGQLGNKATVDSGSPELVWDGSVEAKTLADVRHAVAVGGRHTCAINIKNEVWCWGANHRHQLGSTRSTPQTAPVKVF